MQALRRALQAEGLNPDDAVEIYNRLGDEGALVDIGENLRVVARAAYDELGGVRATASRFVTDRAKGQGRRVLGHVQKLLGKKADDYASAIEDVMSRRSTNAEKIYEASFKQNIRLTDDLVEILNRDSMKRAMKAAERYASDLGDTFEPGSLKHIHYAKQALWDMYS